VADGDLRPVIKPALLTTIDDVIILLVEGRGPAY
jgi:hypothetical protein